MSSNNLPNEEFAQARDELSAIGCDFALLSSLANVTYVSSFEVPEPIGALAEFSYGEPLALCSAKNVASWLIIPNAYAAQAETQSRLENTQLFETFGHFEPANSRQSFLQCIRTCLNEAGLANTTAVLGIEMRDLPYVVSMFLHDEYPQLTLIDVGEVMHQSRWIKTEREIERLRYASDIADIGHTTLAELVQTADQDEFTMWAEITGRMFRAIGHPVQVVGELVTGPRTRTVAYPNGPRVRTTQTGDAVLMDISQRINGYWSDCTNTHVIGGVDPTPEQRRYAKAAQAACEAAMDTLRPGKRAADAWRAADTAFRSFGLDSAHYAGHQIGVTVNEPPRLVPYDDTPIEAGMVFSVEPGVYQGPQGDFGARAEKMVHVTSSGPEILSTFEWGIA